MEDSRRPGFESRREHMKRVNLKKCEVYKIGSQGKIYVERSNKKISTGYLELFPGQRLKRHNRPVIEKLEQLRGTCVMRLFKNPGRKLEREVVLEAGDKLLIPARKWHQHANRGRAKSLTYWRFDGDITNIIEAIRTNHS